MDPMTSTSAYAFFVELDSVEGLLLGQHVYVELAPAAEREGLWIPESFFLPFGFDEASGAMTATMLVEGAGGKLEERSVSLGEYDGMGLCSAILEGIGAEDFVADPGDPGSTPGAAVSRRLVSDFSGEE